MALSIEKAPYAYFKCFSQTYSFKGTVQRRGLEWYQSKACDFLYYRRIFFFKFKGPTSATYKKKP
jgi:hypothetical protein